MNNEDQKNDETFFNFSKEELKEILDCMKCAEYECGFDEIDFTGSDKIFYKTLEKIENYIKSFDK